MRTIRIRSIAVVIVGSGMALQLARQQPAQSSNAAASRETVTAVANAAIPNIPGKRLVTRVIEYAPGGASVSHRHARSAFIYAHVLVGQIRSQVDEEPARLYKAGETWFESPGAHHRVSENASDIAPARLLAVIVVDEGDDRLTIPDRD